MSYQSQTALEYDALFQQRNRAVAIQQADTFKDDTRADFVALSDGLLRGSTEYAMAFTRLAAAGPGIADKAELADGTIDQSLVLDADLLSLTQTNYPVVVGLYFDSDGTPKP